MNVVAVVSDKRLDLFVQTVYANVKKGNLATPTGEQAPINTPEANSSTVSNNSIRKSSRNVNSISENQTETENFKKWFGDWQDDPAKASKVVNADGTPKVMYHGTNAEFTVFDRAQGKKKVHLNVFGDGNYFTALREGASRYGANVVEAYLDIKNPYVKKDGFNTVADQIASEFGIARDSIKGSDVSSFLRQRGYDGVVMYDGNGEIVIANAFSSNQIKSATDNIGTFDKANPDIRYSSRNARDAEGNALTENQERYFENSEVRDEDGNLLPVYHRTDSEFYRFDRNRLGGNALGNATDAAMAATALVGHWFSDHDIGDTLGGREIQSYINIENPYSTSLAELAEAIREHAENAEQMQDDYEYGDYTTTRQAADAFVDWLRENGYDGLIVTDEEFGGNSYAVLDSEQAKLTTNENPTGNEDIRYSSRNSGESRVDRLVRKNEELKAEAEYLKQVVQIQKQGNRKNLRDRESVNAIAKGILESVNAKDTEFGKKLNDFYQDLVTVEMDYDTMQEKAGELADRALEHHQAERDGYAHEVLDFLKKRRVSLTESQIGDAEYTYGSLSEFKKAIRGSIILDENSTTSLNQLWQEAAARFPDRFGADTTEADMPDGIANIVSWANSAEADSETEFQYYKAETKADLTRKILMGFLDAKPIESVSDTLKQQLADLKQQHKQEMKELRKSWDEEAKAMERSHRYDLEAERKRGKAAVEALKYQQEVIQKAQEGLWETERADIKRSYEKQMRELKEQNTQKAHEKVESRHRTEERHKLQNTIDTLNRLLLRPTNTAHVPQELQSSVAMAMKVINGVILDSKTGQNADRLAKYAEQLRKLEGNPEDNAEKIADLNRKIGDLTGRDISMKAALTSLQEQYAKLEGQDGGLYDSNIEALIEDAKETIGNTAYKDLSLKQLKAVRDTYTALLTTIRNANKAFVAGQNARIDDMVKRATIELSMKGKKKPTQTAIGKKVDQFFWKH